MNKLNQIQTIEQCVTSFVSFILLGSPGIGKTTAIQMILERQKINYIRLNCIQCNSKQMILIKIMRQINVMFNLKLKEVSKFSTIYSQLQQLMDSQFSKPTKDKSILQKFYVVFDNIEQCQVDSKFFSCLLRISQTTNFGIRFIFIGLSIPNDIKFQNYEMSLCPTFIMQSPSKQTQVSVMQQCLMKYNRITNDINDKNKSPETLDQIQKQFIQEIIQNYGIFSNNLFTLANIAEQLYMLVLSPLKQDFQQYIVKPFSIFSPMNRPYTAGCKLMRENPFLKFNSYNELKNFLIQNQTAKAMQQQTAHSYTFKECQVDENLANLAEIGQILILACFLGCNNPEKSDKQLMKDYKKKTKNKSRQKDSEVFQAKKVKLERFISITQSLLSIIKPQFEEIGLFDQSLDFYLQMNLLVENGHILRFAKMKNHLEQIKFLCNVDKDIVEVFCRKLDVRLEQFLFLQNETQQF